jgi:hypothetical protein
MGAQGVWFDGIDYLVFTTFLAKELLVLSRCDLGVNGNGACCAKAT